MFPLIDKFNTDNYTIDNQEFIVGSRYLAELRREYTQLGTLRTWPLGEQETNEEGTILSRTYKELSFDPDGADFDFNDAGFDDDVYGGRYYWRVIHKFTEREYYSDNTEDFQNFKLWEVSDHRYQLEVIYLNDVVHTETWERAFTLTNPNPGTPPSGNNPGTPASCPINSATGPFSNHTGQSATFPVTISGDLKCKRWSSIPIPYYRVFDNGKALGAVVSGDYQSIHLVDDIDSNGQPVGSLGPNLGAGSVNNPIKLNKRYLVVAFTNPTQTYPEGGTITYYGVENYRSFLPLSRDEDPEIAEHLDTTPYISHTNNSTTNTRYKPPGRLDFPDNFWNDLTDTPINDYAIRQGVNPNEIPEYIPPIIP